MEYIYICFVFYIEIIKSLLCIMTVYLQLFKCYIANHYFFGLFTLNDKMSDLAQIWTCKLGVIFTKTIKKKTRENTNIYSYIIIHLSGKIFLLLLAVYYLYSCKTHRSRLLWKDTCVGCRNAIDFTSLTSFTCFSRSWAENFRMDKL